LLGFLGEAKVNKHRGVWMLAMKEKISRFHIPVDDLVPLQNTEHVQKRAHVHAHIVDAHIRDQETERLIRVERHHHPDFIVPAKDTLKARNTFLPLEPTQKAHFLLYSSRLVRFVEAFHGICTILSARLVQHGPVHSAKRSCTDAFVQNQWRPQATASTNL